MNEQAFNYGNYLGLDKILDAQNLRSQPEEHDEHLFIIIHQVYELWFKQLLHELDRLAEHIDADLQAHGEHQLKRILKILKTLVAQLDVLETMTPVEFLSFRSFLGSASGFESAQFRSLEFLLGVKDEAHVERFRGLGIVAELERRMNEPSLWARFVASLARHGYDIPDDVLSRPVRHANQPSPAVQDALIQVYRSNPDLAGFCELLMDMDEGIMEWRYRHVMMVMRTIGTKRGTGGSDGAEYLRTTLFRPAFPDLWEIRARL